MSTIYTDLAAGYFALAKLHRDSAKAFPLYSARRVEHLSRAEKMDEQGIAWARLRPDTDDVPEVRYA